MCVVVLVLSSGKLGEVKIQVLGGLLNLTDVLQNGRGGGTGSNCFGLHPKLKRERN